MTWLRTRWLAIPTLALSLILQANPSRAEELFVSTYSRGNSDTVVEYTTSGDFVKTFVAAGSGGLSNAGNLHFGPDANLYVTSNIDGSNSSIKVYDGATGAYLKDFATGLMGCSDFVFDKSGNLYAAEQLGNRVLEFGGDGTLLRTFSDGLSTPEGIALSPDGNLLVTNTYSGTYRNTITKINLTDGSSSTFATGLGEPVGIAAGPGGRYYVANYTFANNFGGSNPDTVQVIGATGGLSSTWNQGGGLAGATYLVFSGNEFFVTSFYNQTVQVFDATTGASLGDFGVPGGASGIAVRLQSVPEPSAFSLLLVGFTLAGARRMASRREGRLRCVLREPSRIVLATAALLSLGLQASHAGSVTIGTPDGVSRDPLFDPGNSAFQQVYLASEFGNAPILITGIAFASTSDSSFSTQVPDLMIHVSTTSVSPSFMNNYLPYNLGPDTTKVFERGPASLNPTALRGDFDLVLTFATPFFYDPKAGNFLIYLSVFAGSDADLRMTSSFEDGTTMAFSSGANLFSFGGTSLLTRISFTSGSVPEPSTLTLLSLGGLGVAGWSRRRSERGSASRR